MFVQFPSRIKLFYVLVFAVLLGTFQLLQGSDPYCVGCVFLFTLIGADACNRCGGLVYPSGTYVFSFTLLTLLLGATWKAFLWEPLDRNLRDPRLTFSVYLAGMATIWVASVANARLRTKSPIITATVPPQHQMRAALGCLVIAVAISVLTPVLQATGVAGTLNQLTVAFYPLSIMLAVYYRVRQTNGRESFSGVAFAALCISFFFGVLSFSKQGMFTPFVAWILAAVAAGYRATWKQIGILSACAVAAALVLVPYSQYGRSHKDEYADPITVMTLMVTNPSLFREKEKSTEPTTYLYQFFDEPQGLMDRLNMLTLDDPLILRTTRGNYVGWIVVRDYIVNIVPHVLLPSKPTLRYGNMYAHEIGVLAPEDMTTGVSFSPVAEAFHLDGWFSLLSVLPAVLLLLFWVSDSMTGSVRHGPWALFFILIFAHAAPEGGIGSPIYLATYGVLAMAFSIIVFTKVAPVIGTIIMGPGKIAVQRPRMSRGPVQRQNVH